MFCLFFAGGWAQLWLLQSSDDVAWANIFQGLCSFTGTCLLFLKPPSLLDDSKFKALQKIKFKRNRDSMLPSCFFLLKFDSIGLPVAASLLINILQLSEAERWHTLGNKIAEWKDWRVSSRNSTCFGWRCCILLSLRKMCNFVFVFENMKSENSGAGIGQGAKFSCDAWEQLEDKGNSFCSSDSVLLSSFPRTAVGASDF